MRVAKLSRTLLLLALPVVPAACALAQDNPNVKPSAVRDQLMKGASQTQPAAPAQSPAAPATGSIPAPAKKKAPSKAPVKTASRPTVKAPAEKPAGDKTAADKAAGDKPSGPRRDPFETLLSNTKPGNASPENLPPGKAGLVVGTLRIDGIVHGANGVIAIVSNPQQRVYFLREGDKLYDGSVEHITLEAITFQEVGKDAFGKPVERQVTKRLYPSPGEQQ